MPTVIALSLLFLMGLDARAGEFFSKVPKGALLEFNTDFRIYAGSRVTPLGQWKSGLGHDVKCNLTFADGYVPTENLVLDAGSLLSVKEVVLIRIDPKKNESGDGPRSTHLVLQPTRGSWEHGLELRCVKSGAGYAGWMYFDAPLRIVHKILEGANLRLIVPQSAGAGDLPTDETFKKLVTTHD